VFDSASFFTRTLVSLSLSFRDFQIHKDEEFSTILNFPSFCKSNFPPKSNGPEVGGGLVTGVGRERERERERVREREKDGQSTGSGGL
jgi:hypothetical protein